MEVTDVILALQHSRLRVSSVILASASPVFKTMLGPAFLEGQDFRSAQYPKEIPLEDDSTAMTSLCFLLHHKRDPHDPRSRDIPEGAEGLFNLAVAADKYGYIEAIRMAGDSNLSYFVYISVSTGMSINALLYLIGTAYVLEDHRQFALLTRRLVMDQTTRFSKVAGHPAMDTSPSSLLCKLSLSLSKQIQVSSNDISSVCRGAANRCTRDASQRSFTTA
jgi:hypothetical protein